jgi:hypothetical protein
MVNNKNIQAKLDKIAEINDLVDAAINKRQKLLEEIKKDCPVDCENFIEQSEYYPGGYLDTNHTYCFKKCNVCGRFKEGKTVNHDSYS